MKLIVFDDLGKPLNKSEDFLYIQKELTSIGVSVLHQTFTSSQEAFEQLKKQYHFSAFDIVKVDNNTTNKQELRKKFLNEHQHSEFEMRYFLEGCGLFYLHHQEKVYGLLCEKYDLISVPSQFKHWFDCGETPFFEALRLFTNKDGWVAYFTESTISNYYPNLEQFINLFPSH